MGTTDRGTAKRSNRFRTLFETSPDAVVLHDVEGAILDANEQASENLGYTREQLFTMAVSDIEVGHDREELVRLWESMDEGERKRVEGRHRRADESTYPVVVTLRKIDIDGNERVLTLSRDITDRKNHEQELERYHALIENSSDVVVVLDDDGRGQYVSPSVKRELGYEPEELVGRNGFEDIHPEDQKQVTRLFSQAIENPDTVVTAEYRIQDAEGSWRWVESRGQNRLDDPSIEGVVINTRVIDDRKEHEQELKRYKTYLEETSDVIAVVDAEGSIEFHSRHSDDPEFSPFGVEGEIGFDYVHPDDLEDIMDLFTKVREEEQNRINTELRVETADDEWRWIEIHGVNKLDDPLIKGIIVSSHDITERKEKERELRQLKDEYETVFNTAQDGIFLFDVEETDSEFEFTLQNLNPAHETISDMSAEEDRGKTPKEFLGQDAAQEVVENYRRCVEAQEPISYEEELEMPAGTIYWQTTIAPVIEDGKVTQIVGVARNITERKERERQLRQFEAFLDNSPTMMTLLEPDGTVLLDKSGIGFEWRHPPEEFLDTNVMEYVHPDDRERVAATIENLAEQPGEPISIEFRFLDQNGEYRWLRTSAVNEVEDPFIEGIIAVSIDITERRRQEAHLEKAQAVGEMGSWFRDFVEEELIWSDEVYEIFNVDPDIPMTHERFIEYVHPDDRTYLDEKWSAALEGEPYDIEHRIVTDDGVIKWLRERVEVEFGEGGEPVGGIGIVQDITDRKERERELERHRRYLKSLRDAVAVFDEEAQLQYLGPAWEEITGYSVEESFEADPFEYVHPDDRDRILEQHQAILDEPGIEVTTEFRFKLADDTYCWLEARVKNLLDDPDLGGILMVIRDISERKQFEQDLTEERDFLDTIIESLPYPFYVLDVDDYTVQHVNSRADIRSGETCYKVTHQRDRPCDEGDDALACPITEIVESGEPTSVEHIHYDDEGKERVFEVHAAPIFDEDGTVSQIAESNIDITERVGYERTLEEQRDNLEVLNQVVRHDIRNDMTVIRGRANLLEEYVDEGGQEDLDAVLGATENVIELTKSARDLSETMLSSVEEVKPVQLNRHIERPVENARSQFRDAVITVDRIPDITVQGNELLEAVFRNLIHNAIVHNDKQVPEVEISTTIQDDTVTVNVADNGPGIPDGRKEAIFGKGETGLDSAGTGIGLYLVQTLVDRYGGEVWVEDNEPEGSVLVVELPQAY